MLHTSEGTWTEAKLALDLSCARRRPAWRPQMNSKDPWLLQNAPQKGLPGHSGQINAKHWRLNLLCDMGVNCCTVLAPKSSNLGRQAGRSRKDLHKDEISQGDASDTTGKFHGKFICTSKIALDTTVKLWILSSMWWGNIRVTLRRVPTPSYLSSCIWTLVRRVRAKTSHTAVFSLHAFFARSR